MALKDYPAQNGRINYVVLNAAGAGALSSPVALRHDEYLIIRDCPECGGESRVIVPGQGLWNWEHGDFVQNAFPTLNAGQREQVKTGFHEACWDAVFGEDEDDYDYYEEEVE